MATTTTTATAASTNWVLFHFRFNVHVHVISWGYTAALLEKACRECVFGGGENDVDKEIETHGYSMYSSSR